MDWSEFTVYCTYLAGAEGGGGGGIGFAGFLKYIRQVKLNNAHNVMNQNIIRRVLKNKVKCMFIFLPMQLLIWSLVTIFLHKMVRYLPDLNTRAS